MEELTRIATITGAISAAAALIAICVGVVVVLSTGRRKSETLTTLETGNKELRGQNFEQEQRLVRSESKIGTLERDYQRVTEQLTQRAAVAELGSNISDMRLEFGHRLEASEKSDERREREAIERHNGVMRTIEHLIMKIDGTPGPQQ